MTGAPRVVRVHPRRASRARTREAFRRVKRTAARPKSTSQKRALNACDSKHARPKRLRLRTGNALARRRKRPSKRPTRCPERVSISTQQRPAERLGSAAERASISAQKRASNKRLLQCHNKRETGQKTRAFRPKTPPKKQLRRHKSPRHAVRRAVHSVAAFSPSFPRKDVLARVPSAACASHVSQKESLECRGHAVLSRP